MLESKIAIEGKRLEEECVPVSSISAVICQGGSKVNYFSRLQKEVWLASECSELAGDNIFLCFGLELLLWPNLVQKFKIICPC